MKSSNKLLTIISLAFGLIGAAAFGVNAQAKSIIVNYVSTTGKVLRAPVTYSTSAAKSSYSYNPSATYPTTGAGFIKAIPGYLPHKVPQTYNASNTECDVHKGINACQKGRHPVHEADQRLPKDQGIESIQA